MRLSALNGDTGWSVYDSKRCCEVKLVQWVDSSTAQWGKIEILPLLGAITTRMQEDRISIYPDRMLVIFNEVDDDTKTTEVEKEIAKIA